MADSTSFEPSEKFVLLEHSSDFRTSTSRCLMTEPGRSWAASAATSLLSMSLELSTG